MKKLLSCIIIGIVVLGGLGVAVTATHQNRNNPQRNITTNSPYEDELDQSMTDYDGTLPVGYAILGNYTNLSVAQSFIPQKELLTRTQFLMAANISTTQPCVLAIRDNLTGENLAVISLEPSEFPVVNGTPTEEQLEWIDFNFDDIWVTPGQIYYIVVYSKNSIGNFYWIAGNGTNIYPNGTVFLSVDDGNTWSEFTDVDGCFKTYGLRETFLKITMKNISFFGLSYEITNIGNFTAWDVVINMTVKGGIFGFINIHGNGSISEFLPGLTIGTGVGSIFGLGSITMSMQVSAANVKEISMERNAKVLFFLILIQ
jgi:hypothetical protein